MDLTVTFAGIVIGVDLPLDSRAAEIIQKNFAAFERPRSGSELPQIGMSIRDSRGRFSIHVDGGEHISGLERGDLLYEIEGIIVTTAQVLRADLIFVHAGVVCKGDRVLLLVGGSGAGKSTLTWALTKQGFRYCSDELAPLQLDGDRLLVHPYPHAICLKQKQTGLEARPEELFDAGPTSHVAVSALAAGVSLDANRVSDILFVSHRPSCAPEIAPVSVSEVAFRVYPQVLNALAHPKKGLGAAKCIAERVNGYLLRSGNLGKTCELVRATVGL